MPRRIHHSFIDIQDVLGLSRGSVRQILLTIIPLYGTVADWSYIHLVRRLDIQTGIRANRVVLTSIVWPSDCMTAYGLTCRALGKSALSVKHTVWNVGWTDVSPCAPKPPPWKALSLSRGDMIHNNRFGVGHIRDSWSTSSATQLLSSQLSLDKVYGMYIVHTILCLYISARQSPLTCSPA